MIQQLYQKFIKSTGVSTDTRKINPGNIFFALRGPNFNANEFSDEALNAGASLSVIDDPVFDRSPHTFLVDDVLKTLQELASFHRRQLDIPFLAITGSNGKTTTKELIRAVLDKKYTCHATAGNLNNHIGVPLTILQIRHGVEIAIIEMGANKPGDIKELCSIAEPTHGIITNIGKAHIEGFGSFEGVKREKSELYNWLVKKAGTVFINSQDQVLMELSKQFHEPVLFPRLHDFYHCELVGADPWIRIKTDNGQLLRSNLLGKYNFPNVAAALCIGKYFAVEDLKAHEAISEYVPDNNRSQVIQNGSNTIILDAYNANPDSMKAALENLVNMEGSGKVAILGDMYELGDEAETEHRTIGQLTAEAGLQNIIFCGELMAYAHRENPNSTYFKNRPDLENYIKNRHFNDSIILIKASRGMALESIQGLISER